MNKIIITLIILGLGWYGNQKYKIHKQELLSQTTETTTESAISSEPDVLLTKTPFKCDGRTHCSQMSSCEEATFFLQNCPDTKMDGNHDGVPCEKQWCK